MRLQSMHCETCLGSDTEEMLTSMPKMTIDFM